MQHHKTTTAKSFSRELDFANRNSSSAIQTGGHLFGDGHVIELVRENGSLGLLLSDGDRHSVAMRVAHCGKSYSPLEFADSIAAAVTFPMGVAPRESTDKLFDDVQGLLRAYDFPEEVGLPTTYFCFATWFPDCLPAAPCFVVTGPRAEASLLFQLLSCLVRHPLQLVDISVAGLRSLPAQLQLTLLVDHLPSSQRALRTLIASTNPNSYIPSTSGVVNLYGARAVYLGPSLDDDLSEEVLLHVNLGPSRRTVPVIDASALQSIASNFQPRFLGYRVRKFSKVITSEWEPPLFASALRVLARILAACIVDAPELQAGVGPLLQARQENIREERWLDVRCIAIEALLAHCHGKSETQAYVGNLTRTAVAILKGRRLTLTLEPKQFGSILRKSLGLLPKRDARGFKVVWTDDVRRKVHRLARDFEVESMRDGVVRCKYCAGMFDVRGHG